MNKQVKTIEKILTFCEVDSKNGKIYKLYPDGELREFLNQGKQEFRIGVSINREKFVTQTGRVVFYYHYGWLPKMIKCLDGDTNNIKITNLKAASEVSTDVPVGVSYCKRLKKWKANFTANKTGGHIGVFNTKIEAIKARAKAIRETLHSNRTTVLDFREGDQTMRNIILGNVRPRL